MAIGLETLAIGTAGTTGTQLVTAGTCAVLYITADSGNSTKYLAIGSSTATYAAGAFCYQLSAGQTAVFTAPAPLRPGGPQLDMSKFYVVASAAGTVYHVGYLERMG